MAILIDPLTAGSAGNLGPHSRNFLGKS